MGPGVAAGSVPLPLNPDVKPVHGRSISGGGHCLVFGEAVCYVRGAGKRASRYGTNVMRHHATVFSAGIM